ncbi:MAG TPA: Maf family protein [Thermoanaerobaculia bacterium]|nr:Maf family protein [Thermoanaerobaculia bacterium]
MLVLASGSPRRAQILTELGIAFTVDPPGVPEDLLPGEAAETAATRIAAAKAAEVVRRRPGAWVLAADTLVFSGGEILGKPRDPGEAKTMLRSLAGRRHRVVTAIHLQRDASTWTSIAWSTVQFSALSDEEIDWYVATGEPLDKAGAYGVQGLGARFVEAISGSYTNVMGLPAREVYRLMRAAGDPALGCLALSSR